MWLARLRPCLIEFGSNVVSTRSIFVSRQHMSETFSVLNFFGSPMIFGQLWGGYSGADAKAANFPCRSLLRRKSRRGRHNYGGSWLIRNQKNALRLRARSRLFVKWPRTD